MEIGDRVRVQVGGESHRGEITSRRRTMAGTVVTVTFWHQGRMEEIDYFENDGALRRVSFDQWMRAEVR